MEHSVQFRNHVGETLSGTLHQPKKEAIGAIIAGHCFTCSRHTGILRRVCKDLGEAGFFAFRFDFSGNGQSQGAFPESTWSKQILEMEAAVSLMKKKGAKWIGLLGHSLGAAIALLTATRVNGISAVCRIAGRLNSDDAMHFLSAEQKRVLARTGRVDFVSRGRELALPRAYFDDSANYDLTEAVQSLELPVLVVHGDEDEIIPVSEAHQTKLANPDNVELVIVPKGNHMLSGAEHQQEVGRIISDWFRRQAIKLSAEKRELK